MRYTHFIKKINCIKEDIEYVQSLKDIREDRETKINDLLGNDRQSI